MNDQTRYAVKVRAPDHAEPEWASLLAARVAPLLDASAVEVVTALVNHAPIAPDSSFADAERLVDHLRTLGVTGILVERPSATSHRAPVGDRNTLKGLLPIPSETAQKGPNTQPFMLQGGKRAPSDPTPVGSVGGRTEPPRFHQATRAYGEVESNQPFENRVSTVPSQGIHSPSHSQISGGAPAPRASGQWGSVTPARIQDRSTNPGLPKPTANQAWEYGLDPRPQTDSYQMDGQPIRPPVHRQTQRLPDPTENEHETTQWNPVAPEPGSFGWPPRGPNGPNFQPFQGHRPPPRPVGPPAEHQGGISGHASGLRGPNFDGTAQPHFAPKPRSSKPTPAMPEMAAPSPISGPFHGPAATYMPTSGPRPAIPNASASDPLSHDPGMAALLSTFLPGMGQVYNGQRDRGIVFALLSITFLPWLVGIYDAWYQAASIRRGEQPVPDPRIWQSARWAQLVLDIAVFTAILVAVDLWVGSKGVLRSPPPPTVSAPQNP